MQTAGKNNVWTVENDAKMAVKVDVLNRQNNVWTAANNV